jgi:hypothetical protein
MLLKENVTPIWWLQLMLKAGKYAKSSSFGIVSSDLLLDNVRRPVFEWI